MESVDAGQERASFGVPPALLIDLYELTMAQSYLAEGMTGTATFSLFARHLPEHWGFYLAAGLDDVLRYLEALRFSPDDRAYLATTGLFTPDFLDALRDFRFTGNARAMPEGTVFFPDEPILEITAPMIEAQIVETAVINQVHLQTMIATKAARCVEAAAGRRLVEFGLRRTHGIDAGMKVARCAYLAGFDATSNVLAGREYGIPIAGTMAHSYIQAFEREIDAFRAYARAFPSSCTLLIDTYDVEAGALHAVEIASELRAGGNELAGVRLDSGDVIAQSFRVREILDAGGFPSARIFASGNFDEYRIAEAVAAGAPIDAFGVGTKMGVSADAPYIDVVYKLVEYDGRAVLKLSAEKATWPGAKQVWRTTGPDGGLADLLATATENPPPDARPLLIDVMRGGRRVWNESLAVARRRAAEERAAMPSRIRAVTNPETATLAYSAAIERLRASATESARLAERE